MKKLLLALCLLLVPSLAFSAGAVVSATNCAGSGPACAITIVSTGNLLLACGSTFAGETVASISDTKSSTWAGVTANQHVASPGADVRCWTTTPGSTGADTVTISMQYGDAGFAQVVELSGIKATFLDTSAVAGGTTGTMASGNFTTTAGDTYFVVGWGVDGSAATPTAGSGWTKTSPASCTCNSDTRNLLEYKAGEAGNTVENATSGSTTISWIIQGFGLKEAAAATTTKKLLLLGAGE